MFFSFCSHAGISVIQWHTLKRDTEPSSDYALYMAFSLDPRSGWSCPVRVDKPFLRKPVSLRGKGEPLAIVLTSYQHKDQTYVAVHRDERPQLLIENKTGVVMFCGQSLGADGVAAETQHFRWNCKLPSVGSIFYTMPLLKDKFPELPQNNYTEKIALAIDTESKNLNVDCTFYYLIEIIRIGILKGFVLGPILFHYRMKFLYFKM